MTEQKTYEKWRTDFQDKNEAWKYFEERIEDVSAALKDWSPKVDFAYDLICDTYPHVCLGEFFKHLFDGAEFLEISGEGEEDAGRWESERYLGFVYRWGREYYGVCISWWLICEAGEYSRDVNNPIGVRITRVYPVKKTITEYLTEKPEGWEA